MARHVLVVEDDEDLTRILELHLTDLGCRVEVVRDGRSGLRQARTGRFDLILLDLVLPFLDGLELCRQLRASGDRTAVLMLTSKSSELDRVLGLEIGADDYLTKPFSMRELLARVKVIFRRLDQPQPDAGESGNDLTVGPLTINHAKRTLIREGREIVLTAKEFDLLYHFARAPGRVFTRAQLLDQVWGYGHDGYEHTVNSHINRLRYKIEADPSMPELILTVWGVGYKLRSEAQA